jgi:Mor family transcriptional regulator
MDITKAFAESNNELIRECCRIIGVEKTIHLINNFGGTQLYIPMLKNLFKDNRNSCIYADFEKGHSFLNLSIKYGLASATIRDIVNKERKSKKSIRSKETAVKESTDETIVALRRAIGVSGTLAIIEQLGGGQIYFPKENTIIKEERESCIYNDFNSGLSFREIAVKYSVSESQARYIVKKRGKNKRDRP